MARCATRKPRLLDLFCGAGGAAMGYHRAGYEVIGVDAAPQPRYPFEFHQTDAMTHALNGYDLIHASPPCQAFSALNSLVAYRHTLDLVGPIRQRLLAQGTPFVIENVVGAPLYNYTLLCGTMFGLQVQRHRHFEVWPAPLFSPRSCCHSRPVVLRKCKAALLRGDFVSVTGNRGAFAGAAMGIGWMTGAELSQAVPPAYTQYLGECLRALPASPSARTA